MNDYQPRHAGAAEQEPTELNIDTVLKFATYEEAAAAGYTELVGRDDKLDFKVQIDKTQLQLFAEHNGEIALVPAPNTIRHQDVYARKVEEVKKVSRIKRILGALGANATK